MLQSYAVSAWRNLEKHKLYAGLNVLGLAIGLAAAILILAFVRHEYGFDRWLPESDRIVRVHTTFLIPDRPAQTVSASAMPAGPMLQANIPDRQIEAFTRVRFQASAIATGRLQAFEDVAIADLNFFDVIRLPFLHGDVTALGEPDGAVITHDVAQRYFGTGDAVGQTFTMDGVAKLRVTGVLAPHHGPTHFREGIFIPRNSPADRNKLSSDDEDWWFATNAWTYLRLAPGADLAAIQAQIPGLLDRFFTSVKALSGSLDASEIVRLSLMKLHDLHLHGPDGPGDSGGSYAVVIAFTAIAGLVLLIAAINFTNLTTARAATRAREVGVRKALGATRGDLILQFMGEAMVLTAIAFVLALAIAEQLMPAFGLLVGRELALDYFTDPGAALMAAIIAFATGALSGLYPALALSRFEPADTLKNAQPSQSGSGRVRTALVVLQFAISIALGIAAMVIQSQTRYAMAMDLGFRADNLLVVTGVGRDQITPIYDALRARMLDHPAILSGATVNSVPGWSGEENLALRQAGADKAPPVIARTLVAEPPFFSTFGMRLLAGRTFTDDPADSYRMNKTDDGSFAIATPVGPAFRAVINALAARKLGYENPADAVGRTVQFAINRETWSEVEIIGVVNDIQHASARSPLTPGVYLSSPDWRNHLLLRLDPQRKEEAEAHVAAVWAEMVPELPLRARYTDDALARLYDSETRQATLLAAFTVLAVAIAALGLFGLASFAAERRTKEIGIRKAMGADRLAIVRLLAWRFVQPALAANLIAWPAAWFAMQAWLSQFAHRITLDPQPFLIAAVAAFLIALATVIGHALQAASARPAYALRYE